MQPRPSRRHRTTRAPLILSYPRKAAPLLLDSLVLLNGWAMQDRGVFQKSSGKRERKAREGVRTYRSQSIIFAILLSTLPISIVPGNKSCKLPDSMRTHDAKNATSRQRNRGYCKCVVVRVWHYPNNPNTCTTTNYPSTLYCFMP